MEDKDKSRTELLAELRASEQRLSIVLDGLPAFVYLLGEEHLSAAERRVERCAMLEAGRA